MGRRAGLGPAAAGVLVVCLLLVAGTAAGDPGTDKARIDGRIDTLRGRAAAADRQAGVLTEELSAVAGQVRELEAGVRAQQARLSVLEGQLSAARSYRSIRGAPWMMGRCTTSPPRTARNHWSARAASTARPRIARATLAA